MTPDPYLLQKYNTSDVWFAKQAGELPLAASVAIPLLGYALLRASAAGTDRQRQALAAADARDRAILALQETGNTQALRGMGPILPMASDVPGYGDDSVDLWGAGKLASEAGKGLAKAAGIGSTVLDGIAAAAKPLVSRLPGIGSKAGWKSQALVGALGVGGAVAGLKAGKAAINRIDAPAKTMVQGYGPALPNYVNEWGTPSYG